MLGITDYLYRLVPANPILLRVVSVGGKRRRDLVVRCGYLAVLIALVVVIVLAQGVDVAGAELDRLSRASVQVFGWLSYFQLALVALMAPVFTAGAITQEKDSQTYDILLSTPLTNGQIVLGTLLSRVFFVFALLLSGVPIFSITQIFGGVTLGDILTSFALAAVTALVTGAVAVGIATFKVGTRRTIFSFFLFIAVYLVGGLLLDRLAWLRVPVVLDGVGGAVRAGQTSFVTPLNPFLCLRSVLDVEGYQPPTPSQLPDSLRWWPLSFALTAPVAFYLILMTGVSALVVLPSVVLLRRVAQSTQTLKAVVLQKLRVARPGRTRAARTVWNNPIAWREAKTKASAARATLTRYGFITLGLAAAVVLCVLYATETGQPDRYLGRGSYAPASGTLTVQGVRGAVYTVTPATRVTVDGAAAGPDALGGRYAVVGEQTALGGGGARVLTSIDLTAIDRAVDRPTSRRLLLGLVFLETCVILLIVTNAAASTVTREKEDGTLDLLLTTPITSRYYLWGKLRGLVSYVLPLVAVPALSVGVFVLYDAWRFVRGAGDGWTVFPEAVLLLPPMLVIVAAFASVVGIQMSLRLKTTVRAVMASLATVLGVVGVLGFCGYQFLQFGGNTALPFAIAAFSPFTVMGVLIAPELFGGDLFNAGTPNEVFEARALIVLFTLIAVGAYTAGVYGMYKAMVTNFDMTIRRQHR